MKGFDDGLYRVWQRLVVYGGCALDKMVQLSWSQAPQEDVTIVCREAN